MSGIFDPAIFDGAIFDEAASATAVGSGPGFHFIDDGKRRRERMRESVRDAKELREQILAIAAGPVEERTVEHVMTLPAVAELRRKSPLAEIAEIAEMRAEIAEILAVIRADEEDEEEAVIMLLAA